MSFTIPVITKFTADTAGAVAPIDDAAEAVIDFGEAVVDAARDTDRAFDAISDTIVDTAKVTDRSTDRMIVALEDTAAASDNTAGKFGAMAKQAVLTGLAVAGFASFVEGARKTLRAAGQQIGEYARSNEELIAVTDSARQSAAAFRDGILSQVLTAENATVVLGSMQRVIGTLTSELQISEGASRAVADAIAGGIVRAAIAAADVVGVLHRGFTLASLGADALRMATLRTTAGVVDLAYAIRAGLSDALAKFIDLLATASRVAGDVLGRVIGEDSVAALRRMEGSLVDSATATRAQTEELGRMRDAAIEARDRGLVELDRSMDATIARGAEFQAQLVGVKNGLRDVLLDIQAGTITMAAYSAATGSGPGGAAESTAALVAELDKLKAARGFLAELDAQAAAMAATMQQQLLDKRKQQGEEAYQAALAAAQAQMDLDRRLIESAQRVAEARIRASSDAVSSIVSGQAQVGEAARAMAGEELRALAEQFRVIAAASFVAMRPIKGAAYAAGSILLDAAASRMGARGGGSGGGAVPAAAAPAVTNVTNRNVSIVATGVVTDSVVRQIAEAVTIAEDGGLLRRSA
jgi:hypothetical protein